MVMWIIVLLASVSEGAVRYAQITYEYEECCCQTTHRISTDYVEMDDNCFYASSQCIEMTTTKDGVEVISSSETICIILSTPHPTPGPTKLTLVPTPGTTTGPTPKTTTGPTPKTTPGPTPKTTPSPIPATTAGPAPATTAGPTQGSGLAGLDPHFRKFNGEHFSYHGECDLVLVSSNGFASGAGLDIHIRTRIKKFYSYIRVVSMRIGNATLEMEFKDSFHINRVFMDHPSEFAGYPISKVGNATWCGQKCSDARIYRISFHSDKHVEEFVELAYLAGFLHVQVNGRNFEDSTGLLGNRRDLGKVGRNGTLIEDPNEYGQDWQVLGSDPELFRKSRYPQHPHKCILPKVSSRRIQVSESTRRMAESACSGLSGELLEMCIFDVQATGDERLALSPFYN